MNPVKYRRKTLFFFSRICKVTIAARVKKTSINKDPFQGRSGCLQQSTKHIETVRCLGRYHRSAEGIAGAWSPDRVRGGAPSASTQKRPYTIPEPDTRHPVFFVQMDDYSSRCKSGSMDFIRKSVTDIINKNRLKLKLTNYFSTCTIL
jgi:hypothetical protein